MSCHVFFVTYDWFWINAPWNLCPGKGEVILSIWNIWVAITVENVSLIYSMNHVGGYLLKISKSNHLYTVRYKKPLHFNESRVEMMLSRMNTIKIIDYDLSDTPCILEVAILGDSSYFCQILKSFRSFHACQDTQFSLNKRSKLQNRQNSRKT